MTGKYREYISKSTKEIRIDQVEKLPHGTLRCFVRDNNVVVGLFDEKGQVIGYELLYQPENPNQLKPDTIIPEWVFDMQNYNVFGTAWDFQSSAMLLWTVAGLRKNGQAEKTINLD